MNTLPTQKMNSIYLNTYICMNTATPSSTSGTPRIRIQIPSLATMNIVTHRNRVEKKRRTKSTGIRVRQR